MDVRQAPHHPFSIFGITKLFRELAQPSPEHRRPGRALAFGEQFSIGKEVFLGG